ncbi:MAG TPA: glutamine-hydrolyzing carbamoyl-phosphate synthase small subunit [Limnochordales bacterium]
MRAHVVLEDGFHLVGEAFVGDGEVCGEIVFNTAHTGYQEVLTDPSYSGQAVVFTYPHIGNYGVNPEDAESARIAPCALIVREYTPRPSNWRAQLSLAEWLAGTGVIGVHQVDTRALVRHLREAGALKGVIATRDGDLDEDERMELAAKAAASPGVVGQDLVRFVGCREAYEYASGDRAHVAVLDFGCKKSILDSLAGLGCRVTVLPATAPAQEILALGPDALVLSNGPGDPTALSYVVETVDRLMGRLPMLGICLGHQIIAQAAGLPIYKLKFGHHGINHPVKDLLTGRVEVTSQNHGFAVATPGDANEFRVRRPEGAVEALVSHRSLYDGTVEGLAFPELKAYSVQYHPEAGPGPHDARVHFGRFLERIGV